MIGWTAALGGLTIGDGTPYGFTRVDGLLRPATRRVREERGDRHGSVAARDALEDRQLSFGLRVKGATPAATWTLMEALLEAWQPVAADTALDVLAADLAGGSRRFFGRPGPVEDDGLVNLRFGLIDCLATFDALDPLGYGPEVTLAGQSGTFNATNDGTAPTDRIQITVNGNGGTPRLESTTDGGAAIAFASAVTGTRVIDVRGADVRDGSVSTYGELSPASTWFDLVPGANELVLTGAASVDVTWRPAWL